MRLGKHMGTVLFLPWVTMILVWISSIWLSYQRQIAVFGHGHITITSGWGSVSISGQRFSATGVSLPDLSRLLKEGISPYESLFTFDNGRPIFSVKPNLSMTLKGRAGFKVDRSSVYLSLPYWALTIASGILPLWWLILSYRKKRHAHSPSAEVPWRQDAS